MIRQIPARGETKSNRMIHRGLRENLELYSMLLPLIALVFLFNYIPMYGIVIAFQDYLPGQPFLAFDGSVRWVGLAYFKKFVESIYFARLIKNTVYLSILNLVFGFWVPIAFALIVNEIKKIRYKKFVQTASYLPHFISSVVIAGLVISFLGRNGLINNFLSLFGVADENLLLNADAFPYVYTLTNVWTGFGFGSILYFSTIASIDPNLYESARIDGASRLKQAWYITLPGIKPVIAIRLILSIGAILYSNTEMILLLYNTSTYRTADVIGTYVYRMGILEGQFSAATAVGFFMSVIGFLLAFAANRVSNRLTGYGLW